MKYAVLLLAVMFAGCDEGSSTEEATSTDGGYETFTIAGETMQVAKEDFPSIMSWYNAKSACEELGNGWRLPNKNELKAMYKQLHKQGKGNFEDLWYYWSSSQGNSGNACYVVFSSGYVYCDGKDDDYGRVRAVRALP